MCSQGRTSNFSGTTVYPLKHKKQQIMELLTDFKKKMKADGNSFAPIGPCKSTRQFPSSETQHSTINTGTESAPTQPKRGRPYHKTIVIVFASRLLQIGDNQGPNADYVGDNVHKMRHTQVVGQDGLFQIGARGHPITRLSAFQPIHNEFGHSEPVQTPEHTGRCPL